MFVIAKVRTLYGQKMLSSSILESGYFWSDAQESWLGSDPLFL